MPYCWEPPVTRSKPGAGRTPKRPSETHPVRRKTRASGPPGTPRAPGHSCDPALRRDRHRSTCATACRAAAA
jgi:hypothetical protein